MKQFKRGANVENCAHSECSLTLTCLEVKEQINQRMWVNRMSLLMELRLN